MRLLTRGGRVGADDHDRPGPDRARHPRRPRPRHGRAARAHPGRLARGRRRRRAGRPRRPARLGADRARRARRDPEGRRPPAARARARSSPSCRPGRAASRWATRSAASRPGSARSSSTPSSGPLHRGRALQGGWDAADLMVHEPRGVVALLVPWNDPVAIACGQIAAALVDGQRRGLQAVGEDAAVGRPAGRAARPARRRPPAPPRRRPRRPAARGAPARGPRRPHGLGRRRGARWRRRAPTGSARPCSSWAARTRWSSTRASTRSGPPSRRRSARSPTPARSARRVERIYVHRAVAAPFIDALVRRAEALRVGDRRGARDGDGPADRRRTSATGSTSHVEDAVGQRGRAARRRADARTGRAASTRRPSLVGPPGDAPVITQETFGPGGRRPRGRLLRRGASRRPTGASTGSPPSCSRRSHANAQRAWRELEVGTVKVNAVFGGAPGGAAEPRRAPGLGFGYGPELLDEMTHTEGRASRRRAARLTPRAGRCGNRWRIGQES